MGGVKRNIQAEFTAASIMMDLAKFEGKTTAKIKVALKTLGENIVNDAKNKSAGETYIDRTSNLRNSLGYKVTNKTVGSNYAMATGQKEGGQKAKDLLNELHSDSGDLDLFVVAGMDYAAPVEAMTGHSVLSGSLPTKTQVEQHFKEILGE